MSKGYPECEDCVWNGLQMDECDECDDGSNFEPTNENEYSEGILELKRMIFVPRHMEIVEDPDEGIPDHLLQHGEKMYG